MAMSSGSAADSNPKSRNPKLRISGFGFKLASTLHIHAAPPRPINRR
jgi:hypothetical protein